MQHRAPVSGRQDPLFSFATASHGGGLPGASDNTCFVTLSFRKVRREAAHVLRRPPRPTLCRRGATWSNKAPLGGGQNDSCRAGVARGRTQRPRAGANTNFVELGLEGGAWRGHREPPTMHLMRWDWRPRSPWAAADVYFAAQRGVRESAAHVDDRQPRHTVLWGGRGVVGAHRSQPTPTVERSGRNEPHGEPVGGCHNQLCAAGMGDGPSRCPWAGASTHSVMQGWPRGVQRALGLH